MLPMKITVFWGMTLCRMIFTDGLVVFIFSLLFQFYKLIRYFHQFLFFLFSFSSFFSFFMFPPPGVLNPQFCSLHSIIYPRLFYASHLKCFLSYIMEWFLPRNSLFFDCSKDGGGQILRNSDN